METTIIMLVFLLIFTLVMTYGVKVKINTDAFLDNKDTLFLKGFWSLIIILVHIPSVYRNNIQNQIGGFAYVGVTFFFITSAFGLKYSVSHKKAYLDDFCYKRLSKLLFPMFVVNIVIILLKKIIIEDYSFSTNDLVNAWVVRLLFVYVVFWFFNKIVFKPNSIKADIFVCLTIILYSLLGCITFFEDICRWNVEITGVVFGIVLYKNLNRVNANNIQVLLYFVLSVICGMIYIKLKNIPFFGDYLLRIVLAFLLNYLSILIIKRIRFGNKTSYLLGTISYEIYLCHPGIINIIKNKIQTTNSGVFIIICVLLSIITSCFLHYTTAKLLQLYLKRERGVKHESITC